MKWTWAGLLALALVDVGCRSAAYQKNPNEEDAMSSNVPVFPAPAKHRCAALGKSSVRSGCDDALYLASEYTRRLSVGDEVCLEGGFGDEPGAACKARASVIDTGPNRVKVEIRQARPDSRWFQSEMRHAWYEEGALVDLYLAERGY
ncbi:hypothetical protein G4177_18210 [Corallococcus sp. ZKHCc1 1396]|uniref:Lipoprotein n=1 Tax=Corallococcus soli TaxID=2710757 RepID=A0ABR9PQB9_9BACT|nr:MULTISPECIES: hypothetical protein [Corallococcus]MBE4750103.1 hypothetical protein [Corallococcus soli]MCY1036842.1 hypothetical protein [Corallococcus sp. BB11-1]